MTQGALWQEYEPTGDDTSTDAYCTPPEVMACVHISTTRDLYRNPATGRYAKHVGQEGAALDPWTNTQAIAHGWVGARTAWTLEHGRQPDRMADPRPWPIWQGDYVHGNPPYSAPHAYVHRFLFELKRARAWGGLLLKTDNRTQWWRDIMAERPFVVMWDGPINFFHNGARVSGNNFASSILVPDYTGMSRQRRYDALRRAYEGKAWVFR